MKNMLSLDIHLILTFFHFRLSLRGQIMKRAKVQCFFVNHWVVIKNNLVCSSPELYFKYKRWVMISGICCLKGMLNRTFNKDYAHNDMMNWYSSFNRDDNDY